MAKKKNKKQELEKVAPKMTEEQRQQFNRTLGFLAAVFAKVLLKAGGCEVDFKINGEDINDIEKLHSLDITARIELAVKEERYEDAAKLKKLLETKPSEGKKLSI
mgnify:CR=1 FL=1